MTHRSYNVLFLCTGNSARSILAEAITNNLLIAAGKFKGFSAGSYPKDQPNPFALELLRQNGYRPRAYGAKAGTSLPSLTPRRSTSSLRCAIRPQGSSALTGRVSP